MGWDTVTTLSTNDDYGQSGMDVFKTTAADFGIEVLSPQEFSPGSTNLEVQLQSVVDSKAKIIVINMITAGIDPTNGELLLKELQNLSFDGATGPISFDENGDRLGVYEIVNLVDGVFEVVGTWDVINGMQLTGTIIWPDGGTKTPADGSGIPGFEFLLAIAGMFALIPILRRRK